MKAISMKSRKMSFPMLNVCKYWAKRKAKANMLETLINPEARSNVRHSLDENQFSGDVNRENAKQMIDIGYILSAACGVRF
jgi:hypothetical protein